MADTGQVRMVGWRDATYSDEEAPGLSRAVSVGFVLEEDDESILLAMERHEIDGTVSFRHFTRIPKVCLT